MVNILTGSGANRKIRERIGASYFGEQEACIYQIEFQSSVVSGEI